MAKDLKPHIGIFGRRNCGKSSLINLLTGQDIAIVSDTAGTTTDPGRQRIDKTMKVLEEIDCAVLVITGNNFEEPEKQLIARMKALSVPFFVVHNKADQEPLLAVVEENDSRKCVSKSVAAWRHYQAE